ncbi:MAG: hypothetical protein M1114_02235 [Candidatus Dependentiae bacterium]|nr:hypothetical protein [Candidatus Dependentiae bacterium]MCL5875268.1 hypothetical protein [Candidatus Dependentiae bacterium]
MKRSSLKKILLSLSLCFTLLCYPYAQVLFPAATAALTQVMMSLTAIAYRLLLAYNNQKPVCIDIQEVINPSFTPNNSAKTLTLTYVIQSLDNKLCVDQETKTLTASTKPYQAIEVMQKEPIAQSVTSLNLSISSGQTKLGSTFQSLIFDSVTKMQIFELHHHNRHATSRTVELTATQQKDFASSIQETKQAPTYDALERPQHAPHEPITQESQKNNFSVTCAIRQQSANNQKSKAMRNYNALVKIRDNATLLRAFREEFSSFLDMIEICSYHEHKEWILQCLERLSDPQNYLTLKQVPYLEERFYQTLGKLQHLCLNEDGSLRGSRIIGHETEIARMIAEFVVPLNGASEYSYVLDKLVELKVPGARALQQELVEYYNQSFVFRIIDSFETKEVYAPLITEKFLSHPFNKDMLAIARFCKNERWDQAKQIADHYKDQFEALRAKGIFNDQAHDRLVASQAIFYRLAYENGVFKKYANHPHYQTLVQRSYPDLRPDAALNQKLEEEFVIHNALLQHFKVTHPSPLVEKIAYHIAPIFYNPIAVNEALSPLSKDHPEQAVRDAYTTTFNEHGIYRLLGHDTKKLEGITLPDVINNASHTKTRIVLNTLLKISTTDTKVKEHIKRALNYVQQACVDVALKDEYTALAQALCDALIIKETDKTVLQLGDFTELCKTEKQFLSPQSMVRDVIFLCEKINQPNISAEERNDLKKKLLSIEILRKKTLTASAEKQITISNFYREKVSPLIRKVGFSVLGTTIGEFIHNELRTPVIPSPEIALNESGQQNDSIKQSDIPPQPSPDPEDPEKESSDIKIDEKSAKHMFGNREGHIPDTPANRELLLSVANSAANFLGHDEYGNAWYAKILETGKQVWVQVWGKLIRNGGINNIPKLFNSKTGLSRQNI